MLQLFWSPRRPQIKAACAGLRSDPCTGHLAQTTPSHHMECFRGHSLHTHTHTHNTTHTRDTTHTHAHTTTHTHTHTHTVTRIYSYTYTYSFTHTHIYNLFCFSTTVT